MSGDHSWNFFQVLLEHSEEKNDWQIAKDEWTALSIVANACDFRKDGLCTHLLKHHNIEMKDLPSEKKKNCICSHPIVVNKFIYNIRNKKFLIVGSCCIRQYLTFQKTKVCLTCKKAFKTKSKKVRFFCRPCRVNFVKSKRHTKSFWRSEYGYRRKWTRNGSTNLNNFNGKNMTTLDSDVLSNEHKWNPANYGTTPGLNDRFKCSQPFQPGGLKNIKELNQAGASAASKNDYMCNKTSYGTKTDSQENYYRAKPRKDQCHRANDNVSVGLMNNAKCISASYGSEAALKNQCKWANHLKNLGLEPEKEVFLSQYLEDEKYLAGDYPINFGKYCNVNMKNFNDRNYLHWVNENIKSPNNCQLLFLFYVNHISNKFVPTANYPATSV